MSCTYTYSTCFCACYVSICYYSKYMYNTIFLYTMTPHFCAYMFYAVNEDGKYNNSYQFHSVVKRIYFHKLLEILKKKVIRSKLNK